MFIRLDQWFYQHVHLFNCVLHIVMARIHLMFFSLRFHEFVLRLESCLFPVISLELNGMIHLNIRYFKRVYITCICNITYNTTSISDS